MRVTAATSVALLAEVESRRASTGPARRPPFVRAAADAGADREDLELAEAVTSAGVDFIALSFVRRADDVHELRKVVGQRAGIVAKIETSAALAELPEIAETSDGLMVARGDLGIDCPLEDVPHLQKRIIRHCVEIGRPVITATQMLESMIQSPSPTRAEVSDVANAVFDGTDAVMLSGETAIGHDPPRWSSPRWPASPLAPSPKPATGSGPSGWAASSARGTDDLVSTASPPP